MPQSKPPKRVQMIEDSDMLRLRTEAAQAQRPTTKRQKKQSTTDEKRSASWRPKASIKTNERIQRAMRGPGSHRLYLLDRDGPNFQIMGATGTVYTVTISTTPHCTCPDSAKGNICKHHLFTMLRVLSLKRDNPLVWQKGLLSTEVSSILSGEHSTNAAATNMALADEATRKEYQRLSTKGKHDDDKKPFPEDDCPICFEAFEEQQKEACVACCTCKHFFHSSCIGKWLDAKRSAQQKTCPLCRAGWVEDSGGDGGGGGDAGGPINLAHVSGQKETLESLYGDRAVFIRASQGEMSRGRAAALYKRMGH